ncbi:MAG: M50 family metallopeptidase [Thermomicrobiales bacterium]
MPDIGYFYIVPILAVLILVHEFGHFITARMCGVKVEEFGIGLPPRLFGIPWKDTLWSVNLIPFGGFVRVKGEDGSNMEPDSMNAKPPHQRAFFLSAGAGMNVLFAIILMAIVIGIQGVPHTNVYITDVVPGSPAAKAGWQAGDRIVEVNGERVETNQEVSNVTSSRAGDEITFTVERRGNLIDTTVIPRENPPEGEGAVGVGLLGNPRTEGEVIIEAVEAGSAAAEAGIQPGDRIVTANERDVFDTYILGVELDRFVGFDLPLTLDRGGEIVSTEIAVLEPETGEDPILATGITQVQHSPIYESVPALKVIPRGFEESYDLGKQMVLGIKRLFSSREDLGQVAGPVGMAQLTNTLVEIDSPIPVWVRLAQFSILLSLNLAILNLIPLPALDGGRLLFVLLEVVRGGRKIAPEKEGLVHFAGLVILLGLMFVIAYQDIKRLIEGNSFLD